MVVSWPARIKDKGGIRTQFAHVNDIMPTILEAVGVPAPDVVEGVRQQKIDGTSLVYSFDNAKAAERHVRQYFELLGNRAIYDRGWMASTTPGRLPWKAGKSAGLPTDYKWELYNLNTDFSQAHDLAKSEPARLAALQQEWDEEARANNVYPLDDRQGIMRAAGKGLPPVKTSVFWGSGISLAQSRAPFLGIRSFTVTADVTIPAGGPRGVLVASGSQFGGWSFGFQDGRPFVVHAASQKPEDQFRIQADTAVPAGVHRLTYDFKLGGFPGQGGTMTIALDGKDMASGRIGRTAFVTAGLGETFDIGRDTGEPVVKLPEGTDFNGTVTRIEFAPR
jgi:arylsulfatase